MYENLPNKSTPWYKSNSKFVDLTLLKNLRLKYRFDNYVSGLQTCLVHSINYVYKPKYIPLTMSKETSLTFQRKTNFDESTLT